MKVSPGKLTRKRTSKGDPLPYWVRHDRSSTVVVHWIQRTSEWRWTVTVRDWRTEGMGQSLSDSEQQALDAIAERLKEME